jgi:pyrroline-5-carboxylate reductase
MKDYHSKDFSLGFIGGGHICEALTRGIILSGYLDPGMIYVSTLEEQRRIDLHKRLGVRTDKNNTELAETVDLLFLSVRPLELLKVCKEIAPFIKKETIVVSVAAGIRLDRIISALQGHINTLRIMPNLPAKVKSSTTVIYSNPEIDKTSVEQLINFLKGFGLVLKIDKEELMDPITVLSGSAPAYYMMIADALIKYGIEEGIPKEICTQIILDTMEGSAQWAMHSKEDPGKLWPMVVTKGGVTAEGMEVFNNKGLIEIFIEGLKSATKKAKEINKN